MNDLNWNIGELPFVRRLTGLMNTIGRMGCRRLFTRPTHCRKWLTTTCDKPRPEKWCSVGSFQTKKPKSTYPFAAKGDKPNAVLDTLCTPLSAKGCLFWT